MWQFLSRHKFGISITVLSVLLLATNVFWLYVTFDNAISAAYRNNVIYTCKRGHESFQKIVDAMVEHDFHALSPNDLLQLFPKSFLKDARIDPHAKKIGTEYVVVGQHAIWFKDGRFIKVEGDQNCMP